MRKDFSELNDVLTAIDENYSSITDFSVEPPFETSFSLAELDVPAMKILMTGIFFLDSDGGLAEAFAKETIEESSFAKYSAYMKIAENLENQIKAIDNDVAELKAEDVSEFQTLKRLKQFFTNLKPALDQYCERSEKDFDEIFCRNLGQRIRQVRSRHGLTVEEFARQIFTSRTNANRYELGVRSISPMTLYRISRAFGVSADWLLGIDSGVASGGSDSNADN